MKRLIILLLLSLIIFSQCESNLPIIGKKKKKEDPIGDLFALCFQLELGSNYNKSNIIQDNGDGTISLVEVVAGGTCRFNAFGRAFGRQEVVTPIYYFKKCIQGQTYRQIQNDCKGNGTSANYWGAQKFQACVVNISCEWSISPSRNACINDTMGSRSWLPGNFDSGTGIRTVANYLKVRQDEIPTGTNDYYWSDNNGLTATDIDGTSSLANTSNLASFNYVLCFNNKS